MPTTPADASGPARARVRPRHIRRSGDQATRRAADSAGEPAGGPGAGVVVDVLALLVLLQAGRAELTADARTPEAAPLGLWQVRVGVVEPARAGPQRARPPLGASGIGGPDRPSQTVRGVVAEPDRLLLGTEPLDGHD